MEKNKKIESKIFKKTIELLNKKDIPFWLESGTLLGIIRDRKIIPGHKHIDIGIPGKYFDKLDTIIWEDRKISIPSNVKEYLRLNYGNWEVPDPDFDPSINNGTIAERGF